MKKDAKRLLAKWIMGVTMAVTMTMNGMCVDMPMEKVEAATNNYGLHNPRFDKDGYTTWDRIEFGTAQVCTNVGVWRVLSVNGNDAFLLLDHYRGRKACNPISLLKNPTKDQIMHKSMNYTWESSWIRKWLNGYSIDRNVWNPIVDPYYPDTNNEEPSFIDKTFTKEEQQAIIPTKVVNKGNSIYKTSGGPDTVDKIYLLSMEEACNPSYGFNPVFEGKSRTREDVNPNAWWLRTPGKDATSVVAVDIYGRGIVDGLNNCNEQVGIRPVLHLDLSKKVWKKIESVSTKQKEVPDSTHIHSYEVKDIKKPTCYRYGEKKNVCTQCGSYYMEALPKSKTHTGTIEVLNKINPTATVPGWTGDSFCKECGKLLAMGKSIPATGKQTITVATIKTYKAKKIKKKATTFYLNAKASGKGKLTYKISKKKKKYISVNAKGKVTLKKGIRKGKYEITITAAAKGVYKKTSKVVVVNVK